MNCPGKTDSKSYSNAVWRLTLLLAAGCFGGLTGHTFAAGRPAQVWELQLPTVCNSSPAIGPKGDIYFGNFDGELWCVSTNGTRQWKISTGKEIWSSPAVAEDGTIYFGCRDRYLYAVSNAGKTLWRFKTGGWVDASPAIGRDGTIFFGSSDNNFYAVDRAGHELWRFKTGGPIVSSAAIGTNRLVYFGSHDGKLYALSPEGREVWNFKTGGAILSSPALDAEQRPFITSVDGFLYLLDKDGRERWKLHTGSRNLGSPVLGNDGRVFLGLNTEFWAITPQGKRLWAAGEGDVNSTPVLSADGTVMFVFEHGQLQGCDADRSLGSQWDLGVPYFAFCSPTLGLSNQLYVLGNWRLCAYQWSSPAAVTPWPKFRGNARNTGNQADWLK